MTSRGRLGVAVALAVVYAVCYSAIKSGLEYAPPLRFGGLRAVVAGAILLALLAFMKRPILPRRRLWPGIVAIAVTGTLMAFAAMFSAPGRTGAGIASVLGNTTPLMTIALAVPFLGETMSRAKAAALVLGFAGAALVAYPALTDPARQGLTGTLLPLAAAAGFAISSVVFKWINAKGAVLHVAAWQLLLGGAPLLAVSALLESRTPIEWNAPFLGLLLFLGLVGTALTTTVWYWLVQRDDVGRLSIALFLVPAVGLGLGVTLFDERLDVPEVLGVGLIFLALAAIVLEGGRRDASTANLATGMRAESPLGAGTVADANPRS